MSMFKKIMDWNEATKAKNKAAAEARTARMNERFARIDAKMKAVDEKNKARFEAAKVEMQKSKDAIRAEIAAQPTFGEIMEKAKADYQAAKESPEYQALKAKSDKQSSVAWKIIKWGLLLALAGPLLILVAAMVGVTA